MLGTVPVGRYGEGAAQGERYLSQEPQSTINFERMLRRRAPLVLLCIVIVAASAYVFAKGETPSYSASASLLFSTNETAAVATGLTPVDVTTSQAQQDTNVRLVQLGNVAAQTAAALGPQWRAGQVKGSVTAAPDSDTSIVTLTATARTAALAQKIANTYGKVFVNEQLRQSQSQISSAVALVNAQFKALTPQEQSQPQGLALEERAQSLALLAKLQTGNVSVAGQAGLPSAASSPKVTRDAALGAILGLLIGLGLALVLERTDRRIRDVSELEAIYELPLLATVPERAQYTVLRALGGKDAAAPLLYDEVFNLLRSHLRHFSVDRDIRTLLVISAGPGEGKTTVSYNLAKASAALGSRVLLIEGDLRRRSMIESVVGRIDPGLSGVLIGDVTMEFATHTIEIGPGASLDVLASGEIPPPNPGELIESQAMESLLQEARASYDLVIVDTPPLTLIADAVPLVTKVDGVIVVSRIGKSSREAAQALRKQLSRLRAPVLGLVANGVRRSAATTYRGGYNYAYAAPPAAPTASSNGGSEPTPAPSPARTDGPPPKLPPTTTTRTRKPRSRTPR
jgi:polysaccharide biosynthesis transport protein